MKNDPIRSVVETEIWAILGTNRVNYYFFGGKQKSLVLVDCSASRQVKLENFFNTAIAKGP